MQRLIAVAGGATLVALVAGHPLAQAPAAPRPEVTVGGRSAGRRDPADDVRHLLRGHQFRRRRRALSRAREEPLVRVPRSAHGLEEVGERRREGRRSRCAPIAPSSPTNPHYLRITSTRRAATASATTASARVSVEGGKRYIVHLLARRVVAGPSRLRVGIENARLRAVRRGARSPALPAEWGAVTRDAHAAGDDDPRPLPRPSRRARARSTSTWSRCSRPTPGSSRPNGLRADLVQLLADCKPGFLRFPGGCIVEGRYLEHALPVEEDHRRAAERKLHRSTAGTTSSSTGPTPDYYQSFGLGFFEYFQLAEDIGAEPLPILNCGMACQFNTGELAPLDQLDPYVQDALDLIEFANGPVTSAVGQAARRHGPPGAVQPEVARRRQRAVGAAVRRALRGVPRRPRRRSTRRSSSSRAPARSPQGERLRLRCGPSCASSSADFVDEHYYQPPALVPAATPTATTTTRAPGPKVFAGEYAAHEPCQSARHDRPNTLERGARRGRVHDRPRAQRRRGAAWPPTRRSSPTSTPGSGRRT